MIKKLICLFKGHIEKSLTNKSNYHTVKLGREKYVFYDEEYRIEKMCPRCGVNLEDKQ